MKSKLLKQLCISAVFLTGGLISFAQSLPQQKVSAALYRVAATNTLMDGCLALYGPSYNNGVDYDDAGKMMNPGENLGLRRDGHILAIERRQTFTDTDTLFLYLANEGNFQYEIDVTLTNMSVPGRSALLVDNYSGQTYNLDMSGLTKLVYNIDAVPASKAADRFMVVFSQNNSGLLLPVDFTAVSATRNPDKTVFFRWSTQNEINIDNFYVETSSDGVNFTDDAKVAPKANDGTGANYLYVDTRITMNNRYFRVKAVDLDGSFVYSQVVKPYTVTKATSFNVFPNPVQNGLVNMQFSVLPSGLSLVRVSSLTGQTVFQQKMLFVSDGQQYSLHLPAGTAPGAYLLSVTDATGITSTITFINQ